MTIQVAPRQLFTARLVGMLETSLGGTRVYRGRVSGVATYPFVVLHDLGGTGPTGPGLLGDGADVTSTYQVDSVGRRMDEAQALGDRVRERMVQSDDAGGWEYPVTVDGWRCSYRSTDAVLGVTPEGKPPEAVFVDRLRYLFRWTPA